MISFQVEKSRLKHTESRFQVIRFLKLAAELSNKHLHRRLVIKRYGISRSFVFAGLTHPENLNVGPTRKARFERNSMFLYSIKVNHEWKTCLD